MQWISWLLLILHSNSDCSFLFGLQDFGKSQKTTIGPSHKFTVYSMYHNGLPQEKDSMDSNWTKPGTIYTLI